MTIDKTAKTPWMLGKVRKFQGSGSLPEAWLGRAQVARQTRRPFAVVTAGVLTCCFRHRCPIFPISLRGNCFTVVKYATLT